VTREVRCADEPRSPDYYKDLYSKLDDRKLLAAVWHLLRNRNLSGFNPGQRAPLNEIKFYFAAAISASPPRF
jgi:hypothetical protein